MRQAGSVPTEQDARLFSDYLFSLNIPNEVEPSADGTWVMWIHNDSQLAASRQELEQFLADPEAPVYKEAGDRGRRAKAGRERDNQLFRQRTVDVRTAWTRGFPQFGVGWLTAVLMGISIMVYILQQVLPERALENLLMMRGPFMVEGRYVPGLPEIRSGELWRLVTPIFLHFHIFHILFNMLWLKQLGSAIEFREGTLRVGLMVLLFGLASNVGQYLVASPRFGGMSGVVYGLFGYIWIRGKYDPQRPYPLDRDTVVWMIGWFLLCLTGLVGPVANTAHAVGLIAGMLWAAIALRRIPFTGIRF